MLETISKTLINNKFLLVKLLNLNNEPFPNNFYKTNAFFILLAMSTYPQYNAHSRPVALFQCTQEIESNGVLDFLDVKLMRECTGCLEFRLHCLQKTKTHRQIPQDSFRPSFTN